MRNRLVIIPVLLLTLALHAHGQQEERPVVAPALADSAVFRRHVYGDTVTADPLPSPVSRSRSPVPRIVVRGTSISSRVARAPQPTSIVSDRELQAFGGTDLSDAITRVPGVFIRSYGGLGGLKTLSLRGTSAQQNVVLIDGVRYQGTAAGPLDLGAVPLESFQQIEVMRGGGASLYGANALGGVVNIVTEQSSAVGGPRASIDAGSFGEGGMDVHLSTASTPDHWSLHLEGRRSDGDYPYTINEFGETRRASRTNGDARRLFGRIGWTCPTENGSGISVIAQGMLSERGVPGAVVQGSVEQARARLDEREVFALGRCSTTLSDWQLNISATARINRLHYRDPDARLGGPQGVDDRYLRGEIGLAIRGRTVLSDAGVLNLFLEGGNETLDGDNLDSESPMTPRRLQVGCGGGATWFFDEGFLGWETLIEGGARADFFSDITGSVSPSLGATWRLGELPVRLRMRGAMSYRAPAFAEQYYLNYGNTDLRPERSVCLDAGGTVDLINAVIETGCFRIDTRDQIVSVPKSPVSWSAQNIARVRSQGMELGVSGTLFDTLLLVRGSYTLMETKDLTEGPTRDRIIPYAPQELASALVEARIAGWSLNASVGYVSHRFTLANEDPATALPRYALVDIGGGCSFSIASIDLALRLECRNLFDVEYQVVRNYPMPGRAFRLVLRLEGHHGLETNR